MSLWFNNYFNIASYIYFIWYSYKGRNTSIRKISNFSIHHDFVIPVGDLSNKIFPLSSISKVNNFRVLPYFNKNVGEDDRNSIYRVSCIAIYFFKFSRFCIWRQVFIKVTIYKQIWNESWIDHTSFPWPWNI